ncbi:MAG TPA: YbhB/YbcL family Raf kinase inhibitor-like protein [Acidimicrobiia bacterium]|nr:YbhB/YbcL family Raf kinase inhibitor-like protein [Acidimicrobiia bacterium]
MDLTSPGFEEGDRIPREHTCDSADAPPELHWSGVPSGVVELALTCVDHDAPGGAFVHWVAWGIDPASGRLGADDASRLGQGRNGFGTDGYRGPCPPPGHGPHRYEFTLYAVDRSIDPGPGSTIESLHSVVAGHTRAMATLTGVYER